MKNYRQLIKELPSKTLVMSVGSFNPPTLQSEMAFKLVEKLVETHNADHVIYVTEEANNLPVDRKIHFLELMFNKFNFRPLHEDRMVAELGKLKSKYKSVIVVTSEDKSKLYESMQVVSTGYPDIEASKLKSMVTKGDYTTFKKNLPSSVRDIDAKRMMNEMRHAQGLEFIKEDVKFSVDALRDKYFRGEIYHIGDIVESAGQQYEIMDRGSNYLVVVNNTGDLSRKWVKDVTLVQEAKSIKDADICETANAGLSAKASKSGISIGTLQKVYRRGVAAWNSGHRPGTTPQQWGMARVNSYITKGKGTYGGADKDLHEGNLPEVPKDKASGLSKKYVAGLSASTAKARAAHWKKMDKLDDRDPRAYTPAPGDANAKTKPSKYTLKYHAMFGESMDEEILEACWTGYKQVGVKKKGSKMVPNCIPESVLNPANPHSDYAEKSKALQDLSRNKDVDQKAVQQRRLDLDKEYKKLKEEYISEQYTTIQHNSDHKVISHGPDFSFKIGKEHHDKIHGLNHREQHMFKCLDGNEYGVHRDDDKLHFQLHPGDTGIHGNMTVHIPHSEFLEDSKEINYKGYSTKNLHHNPELAKSFKLAAADAKDPVAMLNAIKTTDTYLELHGQTGDNPPLDKIKTWKYAHIKAKEALQKIGHFEAHKEQWMQSSDTLDKMLAPHADKLREAIEIGKHSNQNVERSAMTYQQYMKMGKKEPGFVKDTKYGPFTTAIDPNVSQQIDDLEPQWPRHVPTKVGHTYATRDHLRRQKVMYAHHESVQHGDLMDEDFATKFVAEGSGEVGDEIGNDKVVKVKTLPPELAPKKEVGDVEKEKGKGFSALFNGKENVDFDFQTFKNYRLQRENGKKNK
jgi:co-chaperonin GroES (HSP10)